MFAGPISMNFTRSDDLTTGRFRVRSEASAAVTPPPGAAQMSDTMISRAPLFLEINGTRHPLEAPGLTIGRGNERRPAHRRPRRPPPPRRVPGPAGTDAVGQRRRPRLDERHPGQRPAHPARRARRRLGGADREHPHHVPRRRLRPRVGSAGPSAEPVPADPDPGPNPARHRRRVVRAVALPRRTSRRPAPPVARRPDRECPVPASVPGTDERCPSSRSRSSGWASSPCCGCSCSGGVGDALRPVRRARGPAARRHAAASASSSRPSRPKQREEQRGAPSSWSSAGCAAGTTVPPRRRAGSLLGRGPDSTIVLDDDYVSSRHARFFPRDGQWLRRGPGLHQRHLPRPHQGHQPRWSSRSACRSASARPSSSCGSSRWTRRWRSRCASRPLRRRTPPRGQRGLRVRRPASARGRRRHGRPRGRRGGLVGGGRRARARSTRTRPAATCSSALATRRASAPTTTCATWSRATRSSTAWARRVDRAAAAPARGSAWCTSATRAATCCATASCSRSPATTPSCRRLVDEGRITAEEADHHPQRSLLHQRARRPRATSSSTCRCARPGPATAILLCSDGLSGVVSEETLRETLAADRHRRAVASELVELALKGGGPDNITVVVADVVDDAGRSTARPSWSGRPPSEAAGAIRRPAGRRLAPAARTPRGRAMPSPDDIDPEEPATPRASRAATAGWRAGHQSRSSWLALLIGGGASAPTAGPRTSTTSARQDEQVAIYQGIQADLRSRPVPRLRDAGRRARRAAAYQRSRWSRALRAEQPRRRPRASSASCSRSPARARADRVLEQHEDATKSRAGSTRRLDQGRPHADQGRQEHQRTGRQPAPTTHEAPPGSRPDADSTRHRRRPERSPSDCAGATPTTTDTAAVPAQHRRHGDVAMSAATFASAPGRIVSAFVPRKRRGTELFLLVFASSSASARTPGRPRHATARCPTGHHRVRRLWCWRAWSATSPSGSLAPYADPVLLPAGRRAQRHRPGHDPPDRPRPGRRPGPSLAGPAAHLDRCRSSAVRRHAGLSSATTASCSATPTPRVRRPRPARAAAASGDRHVDQRRPHLDPARPAVASSRARSPRSAWPIFFAGYLVVKRDALALAGRRFIGIDLPRGRDLGPDPASIWLVSLGVLVFERDLGTSLLFFGLFVVHALRRDRAHRLAASVGLLLFVAGAYVAYLLFEPRPGARRRLAAPVRATADGQRPARPGPVRHGSGGILGTRLGQGSARPHAVLASPTSSPPRSARSSA